MSRFIIQPIRVNERATVPADCQSFLGGRSEVFVVARSRAVPGGYYRVADVVTGETLPEYAHASWLNQPAASEGR